MATVIKPPAPLPDGFSVFLAGSIEMGGAEPWQAAVERSLAGHDLLIFNPRRDDWDASWTQTRDDPQFREQVRWELNALEKASVILFYFDPNTRSPVSLLELGLFARSGKAVVCCPTGFWRKGNVDIVCEEYGVPQVDSRQELVRRVLALASDAAR